MGLFVSTVSADVSIHELGITLVHPTVDYDLSAQFSGDDIKRADSLTTAITGGALTWRRVAAGTTEAAADYDPDFLDVENEATGGAARDRVLRGEEFSLIVKKDPGTGEFGSLKAALAAASGADPTVVTVFPGVYVEDNASGPIAIPAGVTVQAHGNSTVIFEPSTVGQDLLLMNAQSTRFQGCSIRNVTGAAAIKITTGPLPAVLDFVTISNCQRGIVVESSSAAVQAVLRNIRLISGATTTRLLDVIAGGGFEAVARIYSAIITDDNGTAFEVAIRVTGTGARVDPNTALMRSTTGVGKGILVDDGAHVEITSGAEALGFLDNLVFGNSGAAPTGQIQALTCHHGVDSDIRALHAGTTASLVGIARRSKVFNAAPTTFMLSYSDPDNANFNNTGMLITRGLSPELQTIATAGQTVSLTRFDPHATIFTGSTAGTILRLPNATTFSKTGHLYDIWNFSTQDVEIDDNGGNLLATLKPNGHTVIILRDISTSNGVWGLTYTIDSGNVFGAQLYYVEDNTETSNNSSTTWVNKITLVTPALPFGDYLTQYQFNWRSENADRQLDFRVQREGVDVDAGKPFTGSVVDRQLISGFRRAIGLSGIQNYTLDFRRGASGTTVYMYNARLFVWRVG